jgi:outer membrane cobalamin receptor
MKSRATLLLIASALATSGCGIKPRAAVPDQNIGTIITQEQIAETGARTMWDALTRTVRYTQFQESGLGKPQRIRRRGSSSIVLTEDMPIFIDRVRVTDIQVLASLPARDIARIQVLSGLNATTYYGTNSGDGVILIQTLDGKRRK